MNAKKKIIVTGIFAAAVSLQAGQIDGSAVLGSAIGAAAGSAVGSAVGGKEGAVIGGGIGGAVGAAAGSSDSSVQQRTGGSVVAARVVGDDEYRGHRDNGLHKGHHKHKHKHH
ncbi:MULTISPECIES: glycine zipper domain-containing protein [unclassified Sulfuricurvum]|uniref:glycine zipper domain-containing protein n=1 Tax=unclassified Sulfuricurvum TaxID=2632390 RepID=UPI000A43A7CD|nr:MULTISPECIES: glycine zipper domain-containing protein [unclassified Sulfuricurvum]